MTLLTDAEQIGIEYVRLTSMQLFQTGRGSDMSDFRLFMFVSFLVQGLTVKPERCCISSYDTGIEGKY